MEDCAASSELVWLLVQLDKDYAAAVPDMPSPQWYAADRQSPRGEGG